LFDSVTWGVRTFAVLTKHLSRRANTMDESDPAKFRPVRFAVIRREPSIELQRSLKKTGVGGSAKSQRGGLPPRERRERFSLLRSLSRHADSSRRPRLARGAVRAPPSGDSRHGRETDPFRVLIMKLDRESSAVLSPVEPFAQMRAAARSFATIAANSGSVIIGSESITEATNTPRACSEPRCPFVHVRERRAGLV